MVKLDYSGSGLKLYSFENFLDDSNMKPRLRTTDLEEEYCNLNTGTGDRSIREEGKHLRNHP